MTWIFQVSNREVFLTREIKGTLPQPTCSTQKASTYKLQQKKKNSKNLVKEALVYLTQYIEMKENLFIDIPDKLQICTYT